MRRALARGAAAAACALWATASGAVIPSASRIAGAVAETNRASGRAEPLLLEVSFRIGDGGPAAQGEIATHPTGLARLELQSRKGFVERHLLQGNSHTASRDGQLIANPHPFLPPVFLLQVASGPALSAALASFGIAAQEVALGRIGDRDCYVLGGRLSRAPDGSERRLPSVWVDMETFQVLRIDVNGVRYQLGPPQVFQGITAPRWISIEVPGRPTARLDVLRASTAAAPAAAFGADWLTATDAHAQESPGSP